jgi:hypothetical protein
MSYNLEGTNSGFMSLSSGAVAAGTNAGTIQNVAAVNYVFDAVFFQKAITNNIAVTRDTQVPAFTTVPVSSKCNFAFFLDAAGNVTASQGVIVAAGGVAPNAPVVSGKTLFAVVSVVTNGSTTFVPGTTAFGAAGITSTFLNVMDMPGTNR